MIDGGWRRFGKLGRADGVQDTRNKVHATVACPVELVGVN